MPRRSPRLSMEAIVPKESGFTVVELLTCLVFLAAIAAAGGIVWAACHFIAKFW